tara:strand:- start:1768 stop:2316 length:549 start_codon:yes stop_codon:yes gene_type:complete
MSGLDNKRLKEKGMTILEALVSTAIVAIGFIAIFQMVNYSIQSIDVSGERTKSNYLVSMVAEDLIGDKNSTIGTDKLYDWLVNNKQVSGDTWAMTSCSSGSSSTGNLPDVQQEKFRKWDNRFSTRRIKCRGNNDTKSFKVFDICRTGCTYTNSNAYDKIYLGRMEVNINNGKKKKYLYFQIH